MTNEQSHNHDAAHAVGAVFGGICGAVGAALGDLLLATAVGAGIVLAAFAYADWHLKPKG